MTCGTLFKYNGAVRQFIVEYVGEAFYLRVYRTYLVNSKNYSCVVACFVCKVVVSCIEDIASVDLEKSAYIRIQGGNYLFQIQDSRTCHTVYDSTVLRTFEHFVKLCEEAVELLVNIAQLLNIGNVI